MRLCDPATVWLGLLVLSSGASGEPLVWERFENSALGIVRGGVSFSNDVVGYGRAKKVTSTDFTVEAFVKPARRPSYDAIAADWNEDGNQRSWALVLLSNGGLRFDVSPDGDFYVENKLQTPPRLIQPGTW